MIYKAPTSIKNHTFTLLSKYCVHNFGNWRKNRQTDRLWTHYLPLASLEAQKLRVIMTLLLLSVSVFHSRRWRGFIPQRQPLATYPLSPSSNSINAENIYYWTLLTTFSLLMIHRCWEDDDNLVYHWQLHNVVFFPTVTSLHFVISLLLTGWLQHTIHSISVKQMYKKHTFVTLMVEVNFNKSAIRWQRPEQILCKLQIVIKNYWNSQKTIS